MSKMILKDEYDHFKNMMKTPWWWWEQDWWRTVWRYDTILQCCQIRLHINEWYEEDQFDEENGGEYDAHDGSAKIVMRIMLWLIWRDNEDNIDDYNTWERVGWVQRSTVLKKQASITILKEKNNNNNNNKNIQ